MSNTPLVSVCIPAYNCENYIVDTIKCLLGQTYTNLEIVVVNDGSTDETLIKLKTIAQSRLKLIDTVNGGAAKARNLAYHHSKGEYIIFFDADDLVDNNYIESQLNVLKSDSQSIVVAQWGRFYKEDKSDFELIKNPNHSMTLDTWVEEFWYHVNPMTNPGRFLIPRNIIESAGLWNENLSLNDDLEFFTRVFSNSKLIIFNDYSTFYYRSGINGLSGKKGTKANTSLFKSVKLSTEIVLNKYKNAATQKACANMWQSLIYILYNNDNNLVNLAEKEISSLVKSDLKYPSGGFTNLSIKLLGWKLTAKLKSN